MKINVDADACPKNALQICSRIAQKYSILLQTVASFNHDIISDNHITVGNAPQETDLAIINMTDPGDIIVTQDWGLAALALGRGAEAISPTGKVFQRGTIDLLLEEREFKAKLRRGGKRTKGPRKRTTQDDQRFAANLCKLIEKQIQVSSQ